MKKFLAVVLVILMVATSVFAQGAQEVSATGKTVITFWAFPTLGNDGKEEAKLIEAFEKAHPDIQVKLELIDFTSGPAKITSAIEGGVAPDVVLDAPGRIIEWGTNGKLVALDNLFTSDYLADIGGLANACTDGTHYYMYPLSSAPFWMSINKEMWQAAGAWQYVNTEGDRLWTTEAWAKAMEALGKAGQVGVNVYCGGQGGDQGTRALVNNLYSSAIYDGSKWNADTQGNKKALELLLDLYKKGAIDFGRGIAAADELQLYQQQAIASTICWGTSNAKNFASDAYTQFSVPFPSEDGKPELEYLANGFCVFDNKDPKRAEAAIEFVKFVCDDPVYGPQAVKASAAFPARASFGNLYGDDAEYKLLASWTQYYGPYYNTKPKFAQMRTQWWNMLQYVSTGDKSIAQAVKDFDVNANK